MCISYSHPLKCEIHADKVNADSDKRNKQTHHGNDRDGSKDVATVSATVAACSALLCCCCCCDSAICLCDKHKSAIAIARRMSNAMQAEAKVLSQDQPSPLPSTALPLSHIERLLTTAHKANTMRMRMRDSGHLY